MEFTAPGFDRTGMVLVEECGRDQCGRLGR